jgi:hypothetical protein
MSLESRDKSKKDKRKEEISKENIPDNLQEIPEPVPKPTLEPPKPISFQEKKGDVPRPTRLPPRFKERFKPKQTEQPSELKSEIKTNTEQPQEIEEEKPLSTTKIQPPVKIRQRRDSIPVPEGLKEKTRVQPTRIELEEEFVATPTNTVQNQNQTQLSLLEEDPLLKQFDSQDILERPKEKGWPWVVSRTIKIPAEMELYWKAEASLYSAISMLHFYSVVYEKGELAQEVYSKQLKSHLLEAIQLRFKLEKDNKFNWEDFVKENHLIELFAEGIEKLARVTGSSDIDAALDEETIKIDYQEIKKLPTKAADYVGNAIELMDIVRLQSIATVERLIPLIEDMKKIIMSATIFDTDYWALKEMDLWTERFYTMEPGTIPTAEELERFEMYVVRWLNDFRRELKNI